MAEKLGFAPDHDDDDHRRVELLDSALSPDQISMTAAELEEDHALDEAKRRLVLKMKARRRRDVDLISFSLTPNRSCLRLALPLGCGCRKELSKKE